MRVGVVGAGGRMGSTVCATVSAADDLELVAAVDSHAGGEVCGLAISPDVDALVQAGAQVVVDFTVPDAVMDSLKAYVGNGIHAVIGTSGFDTERLDAVASMIAGTDAHVMIVPNFAVGAVLMARLAEIAAPHFDRVEVVELHHDGKVDAPSGTAIDTARRLAGLARAGKAPVAEKELFVGARGATVGDVKVHSLRLPGLVAHQEIIMGTQGQTLTIRHDSIDRSSFMPGVLAAVRAIGEMPGLTVGLERVLGI